MKKFLLLFMSLSILLAPSTFIISNGKLNQEEGIISDNIISNRYGSFTGTVESISDFSGINNAKFISLIGLDKNPINMVVTEDVFIYNKDNLKVGATVTGVYDYFAPMIMIYPPQYSPKVVVVHDENMSIKLDIFDNRYTSKDNYLKLNISADTLIFDMYGKVNKEEIKNQELLVIYGAATKSIPAITNPKAIIVLDTSIHKIIVENQSITNGKVLKKEDGTYMVPLRDISTLLGYKLSWNAKDRSVSLNNVATIYIDKDSYAYGKMSPVKLGIAPELINNTTYVPLSFFEKVLPNYIVGVETNLIYISKVRTMDK